MSASWDSKSNKFFLDLCVEEVRNGGRPRKSLTVAAWENVMRKFKELTNKDYNRKQFRNHWDALLGDWKTFQSLKNLRTGLGWHEENGTITASEEWWSDRIQQDKKCAKFKNKGLEHYELMEEIFGGTSATGEDKYTPNAGLPHPSMVHVQVAPENVIIGEVQGQTASSNYPVPIDGNKGKGVKRKRESSSTSLTGSFDKLITAFEKTSATSRMDKYRSQIGCAISLLMDLPGLEEGSSLQVFGVQKMVNADWREVFMALPKPELQLSFLKAECEQEQKNKNA